MTYSNSKLANHVATVTHEDVKAFFDDIGVDPVCSVCGSDLTPFPGLLFEERSDDEPPQPKSDPYHPAVKPLIIHYDAGYKASYTVPVITTSCRKCGFIMRFMAERIAEWKVQQHGDNES